MSLTVGPALFTDLAEREGAMPRAVWAILKRQVHIGEAWSARTDAGELVALFGFLPLDLEEGPAPGAIAWFSHGPAASRHMLAFARVARLTLAASPYGHAVVQAATAAGARLARCAGFQPIPSPPGEPARWVWRRHGSRD